MRTLVIVVGLLAGCSGNKFDDILGEMAGFRDRMCACADAACGDKVEDDWRTFRTTMKDRVGKAKPTAAQDKHGNELDDEMRACRRRLAGSGASAPAPAPARP